MGILLTREERPRDTTNPERLDPIKLEVFKCGFDWGAEAGAKAQLEKVLDKAEPQDMSVRFRQALLKEVE